MKNFFSAIAICCVVVMVASCAQKQKPTELHIFNWGDYMDPAAVAQFEKVNHVKIFMDNFDSNEAMYAKLKAGATGYDLVIASSYMMSIMNNEKMLKPIDKSKLSNITNIDNNYLKLAIDPTMTYSVPYMVSFVGIAYNTDKVANFEPSWAMFNREDLKGRMTLLDDVRETIGAALKYRGYNFNSTDDKELAEARDVIIGWKKNIAKFDVDEAKRGLDAGEFHLIHTYNGDALQLMSTRKDIAFAAPKEGTAMNCDDMVIPVTAKNDELAYKFINFMLEPSVSAASMNYLQYLAPNTEAQKLMDPSFMNNPAVYPTPEVLSKSDILKDLGADNAKYNKIWDEIKAAN